MEFQNIIRNSQDFENRIIKYQTFYVFVIFHLSKYCKIASKSNCLARISQKWRLNFMFNTNFMPIVKRCYMEVSIQSYLNQNGFSYKQLQWPLKMHTWNKKSSACVFKHHWESSQNLFENTLYFLLFSKGNTNSLMRWDKTTELTNQYQEKCRRLVFLRHNVHKRDIYNKKLS